MLFLHFSNWKIKSCKLQLGRSHSLSFRNEVKYILYFCQLNCIFLTGFVLSKCTAKLIGPLETSIYSNDHLCPDPMEYESVNGHSVFHQPNNVLSIYMASKSPDSTRNPTCRFKAGQRAVNYDITLKLILQRRAPVSLKSARKCSEYFELLGFDIEEKNEVVNKSAPNSFACTTEDEKSIKERNKLQIVQAPSEQFVRFFNKKIQFEIPYQLDRRDPVAILLFKVETENNPCFFQVQQYYWSESIDETAACNRIVNQKLSRQICGIYDCMEGHKMIQELDHSPLDMESDETKPLGFFLKGFIIPGLMVVVATLGYLIWKRRMKSQQRMAFLNGSTPQGTQTGEGASGSNPRNRRNWNMHSVYDNDDDYSVPLYDDDSSKYPDDPPPPYEEEPIPPLYEDECVQNPPTYDEAILK